MDLLNRFAKECTDHMYWQPSEQVVIAVSGGVDSMVLYDLVTRLPEELRPEVAVVHVNHQLREASHMEEAALQQKMAAEDTPFYSTQWPEAHHPQTGVEEAARAFRYQFFKEVMHKTGAQHLLTAHHRGDQLETLLMRFVRGGYVERMTGIRRIRPFGEGNLIRPLLSFSKEELYAHAHNRELLYFEDATNQELDFTRNRYRHTIIPLLKQENPAVEEHAEQFSQDMEDLLQLVNPVIAEAIQKIQKGQMDSSFSRTSFLELEASLQRLVLARLLQKAFDKTGKTVTFKRGHTAQIIRWIEEGSPNSRLNLPAGRVMQRVYDTIRFISEVEAQEKEPLMARSLNMGEWQVLPDGSRIGLQSTEDFLNKKPSIQGKWIYLNPADIRLPLTVRNRRPGDRMTPKGMRGTKKVKDIFIDQKVPAREREEAVVVTDADGEILWLVNFKESSLSKKLETDTIQYILIFEPCMSESIKGE
ncbi:tRNA lysidine(34) synthetase TilS [Atopococcus tabaci]|uniref:tRNA lysidine(34) synthetase TilS n=1 Tax=Atopococcus tabaci TaxID=269774 RepID=UPI0004001B9C|nr:tRNA lysidine(34) synthetase TilS [Atopococcus tabaci]